jgi:hypothetical protein
MSRRADRKNEPGGQIVAPVSDMREEHPIADEPDESEALDVFEAARSLRHAATSAVLDADEPIGHNERGPDDSIEVVAPVERARAVIGAEWLEQKLRVECEQAKLDSLADELGRDVAAKGETRHPIRIGAGLYKTRKDRDAKTFTLIPYVAPTALEVL